MKNPPPPPRLVAEPGDHHLLPAGTRFWRIALFADRHATPYGRLRHWGPTGGRWEPMRPVPGKAGAVDPERGVLYVAVDLATSFAEVYQDEDGHVTAATPRIADIAAGGATALSWRTTRALRLLDLTGTWAVRNRASHSLAAADRDLCREWARAIADSFGDLDGLWVPSTMTGRAMPVLFTPAADSFPSAPDLSRPLVDPALRPYVERAAWECGFLLAG